MKKHILPFFFYISMEILIFVIMRWNEKERNMERFLSIKETIEKYIDGCQIKMNMSSNKLMGKSILAGVLIGLGAAASSVAAHAIGNVGIARLVAAVVFPVGLMMVIMLGAELFTGDCLVAMSVMDGKQKIVDVIRLLVSVYIGNFIGASLLALMIGMSGQLDYSGGLLGAYTIKVAVSKVNISFSQGMISGILCNVLVCAAVLMAMSAKDIAGKLLAVFFTIMLFVTAGFEHCVANMYYITAGIIAKSNPEYVQIAMNAYGYTMESMETLNLTNYFLTNLVPVTVGNIIGGAVLFGVPMFLINTNKEKVIKRDKKREEVKNDVIYTAVFTDASS